MGQSAWSGNVGIATTPIYFNMLTAEPDVVGQGTWINAGAASNYLYQGYLYNSSNADGDNMTVNFRCPAGTYTLRFNVPKGSNLGILDMSIDGDLVVDDLDLYSAAVDFLNISESSKVLAAGTHTLKFEIDGKNSFSSAHFVLLSGIVLQRTA